MLQATLSAVVLVIDVVDRCSFHLIYAAYRRVFCLSSVEVLEWQKWESALVNTKNALLSPETGTIFFLSRFTFRYHLFHKRVNLTLICLCKSIIPPHESNENLHRFHSRLHRRNVVQLIQSSFPVSSFLTSLSYMSGGPTNLHHIFSAAIKKRRFARGRMRSLS